jgi:DNA modification methylase
LYAKEGNEKDTTYSSLWLYRKPKEIPEFKDPIGSESISEAKKKGIPYFSEFNPLVAENIINFWSDENDTILDPFAGRTRGIVAGLKHRKYFGFEVSPIVANAVNEIIEKNKDKFADGFMPKIICDDSFNLDDNKYGLPIIDCIFTCPPYWNLEVYESAKGQLSDIDDYFTFLRRYQEIMQKAITKLKDNGFVCLVVGDFRKDNKLIPFDCDTYFLMETLGLTLWDKIVLQNINFGWASFKFGSAKHKRQTAKVTEYLLVFKKVV